MVRAYAAVGNLQGHHGRSLRRASLLSIRLFLAEECPSDRNDVCNAGMEPAARDDKKQSTNHLADRSPGAGKSTLARALEARFISVDVDVEVLDGEDIRKVLSSDLGFTKADRDAHVRRVGHVAQMLRQHRGHGHRRCNQPLPRHTRVDPARQSQLRGDLLPLPSGRR